MKSFFVNEAFDKAINDYLISKNKPEGVLYNSFLPVVIRMLVTIYGELDIINPYQTKNEESLNNNLAKYGYELDKINEFKNLILKFYEIDNNSLQKDISYYFVEIQKRVIDMFNARRINYGFTESERKEFFDLLYTPGCSNALRISYNFKIAKNIYEVAEYYKNALTEPLEKKVNKEEDKNLLSFDVYKLFGFGVNDLSKMNAEEINGINREIYKSFDIKENAINKDYLLEEKIKEIKMQSNSITTGNGYVDILLIMSVIVTTIMVILIFGIFVF